MKLDRDWNEKRGIVGGDLIVDDGVIASKAESEIDSGSTGGGVICG